MIVLPIGDINERERRPYVNYALLALNIGIALLTGFRRFSIGEDGTVDPVFAEFAVKANDVTLWNLFTSMFLHDGFLHLAGNMLFLWIFGDNVEDTLGHVGYAVFYVVCGFAAGIAQVVTLAEPMAALPYGFPIQELPVHSFGASGAISGVIAAYAVFYPQNKVKMLIWIIFFIHIMLWPAWLFVGVWTLLQIYQMSEGVGGVGWWAHLGGLGAGAVVAGVMRGFWKIHKPIARQKEEIWETSRVEPSRRGAFVPLAEEEVGIEFIDSSENNYAVVKLTDDPHGAEAMGAAAASVTGEPAERYIRRIAATRGMIARGIPRAQAEKIRQEIHTQGFPSAIILDAGPNRPPEPVNVESVSWNDSLLRLRIGDQSVPLPWSVPFLYVAADVAGAPRIDIFINRRTAYRLYDRIRLTKVDTARRSEFTADAVELGRDILRYRGTATTNEGVRLLSEGAGHGWFSFALQQDYDDYLFWMYNLALSRAQGDLS